VRFKKTWEPVMPHALRGYFLALALAMIAFAPVSYGQTASPAATPDQHNAHHSGTAPATKPASKQAPASSSAMSGRAGMKGGHAGMMDGGMGEMMAMMQGMAMMRGMVGDGGAMIVDHVEGRLAFLRTELKITDSQMPQWSRFADALHASAKSMGDMQQMVMKDGKAASLPARIELQQKMLSTRLDALNAMKAALEPLYASLSDEQKKLADDLMMGPMGMMM
jgi:hypothetical protein